MTRPPARTRVALGLSLIALVAAIVAVLSLSPQTVARSNGIETAQELESVTGHFNACQANETVPGGTTAIRLSLKAVLGPRIALRVLAGRRLVASGERAAGWTAADVTVPVGRVAQTVSQTKVCIRFLARDESVGLIGQQLTAGGHRSQAGLGLIKVEYLRPGDQTWWALVPTVARRLAFGHAWSGIWVVPFLGAAMAAVLALVAWLALRLAR